MNEKLTHAYGWMLLMLAIILSSSVEAAILTVTNSNDSGAGSLRNTIAAAVNGDSIIFSGAVSSITLNSSIVIGKNLIINGGVATVKLGNGTSGLFQTTTGTTVKVRNLHFTNINVAAYSGIALNNAGTMYVYNCAFDNLSGTGNGAAIFNGLNASIRIYNCSFSNNYTEGNGGALANAGTMYLYNCNLQNNVADQMEGGAIYNFFNATTNVNLYDCTFSRNRAFGGGAIAVRYGSKVNAYNCLYEGNYTDAAGEAGAILNDGITKLYGCTFMNDTSEFFGGAISNYIQLNIEPYNGQNCSFLGNYCALLGGGIYNLGTMTINTTSANPMLFDGNIAPYGSAIYNGDGAGNGTGTMGGNIIFKNNTSDIPNGQGGAVFNDNLAHLTINAGVTFKYNYSEYGGGVYNNGGYLTLSQVTFNNNSVGTGGAALYISGGIIDINLCSFSSNLSNNLSAASSPSSPVYLENNQAISVNGSGTFANSTFDQNQINGGDGGALTVESGTWNFKNCTFAQNIASGLGGAIKHNGGTATFTHCSIAQNTATDGSGIYSMVSTSNLNNTVVVGNTPNDLSGNNINYGSTLGHNLVGAFGSGAGLGGVMTGDQTGLSFGQIFGNYTLGYVNGSTIKTYRLPIESLAINAAANALTTDQLGNPRDSVSDAGAYEATISLLNIGDNTVSAADEYTGITNWTHYFDSNGNLLLSIFKNGQNQLGTISAGNLDINVGTTSDYGTGTAHNLSSAVYNQNSNGWYSFNRFWKVNLQNVGQQPNDSVAVRFYYTDSDLSDLKNTVNGIIPNSVLTDNDVVFYKTDGANDPLGLNVPANQIHTYTNAVTSTRTKWKKGNLFGKKYAEFWVTSFSGGSGGAAPGNSAGFPVEFIDFTVKQQGENNALLRWKVASELNSEKFVVERSIDGVLFEDIGSVPAAGTSQEVRTYEFKDDFLNFQQYYYRIKEVDVDGRTTFSNIELVILTGKIFLFPNPVENNLYISTKLTRTPVQLFDMNGVLLKEFETTPSRIDMSDLPRGFYYVKIGIDGYRIIKSK